MEDKIDMSEIQDYFERIRRDVTELTALIHVLLEGVRSDSVDSNEIMGAICGVYKYSETVVYKTNELYSKMFH